MLRADYHSWSLGGQRSTFPPDFSKDDHFRRVIASQDADGRNFIGVNGNGLPQALFCPEHLAGYRILLENAGHIMGVDSRLVHCLKFNSGDDLPVKPGEYVLYSGYIELNDGNC